jgi:hypothetical protein
MIDQIAFKIHNLLATSALSAGVYHTSNTTKISNLELANLWANLSDFANL